MPDGRTTCNKNFSKQKFRSIIPPSDRRCSNLLSGSQLISLPDLESSWTPPRPSRRKDTLARKQIRLARNWWPFRHKRNPARNDGSFRHPQALSLNYSEDWYWTKKPSMMGRGWDWPSHHVGDDFQGLSGVAKRDLAQNRNQTITAISTIFKSSATADIQGARTSSKSRSSRDDGWAIRQIDVVLYLCDIRVQEGLAATVGRNFFGLHGLEISNPWAQNSALLVTMIDSRRLDILPTALSYTARCK